MLIYTFDRTLDGVLTAVFDAYALRQQPDQLVAEGAVLPMFCDAVHQVVTAEDKAARVWAGLEKKLTKEALHLITVSWQSESRELDTPLFHYIYKVFAPSHAPRSNATGSIERNFSDPDVLYVTNTARRVMHERLRMMQFLRFQKAKDGTYLGVISPDQNVLPLITSHFRDRFGDQPWLIYDARRRYGYYYQPPAQGGAGGEFITFQDEEALPFSLEDGKLDEALLSDNDKLLQDLWRTYFKAICIRERMNPRKQLNDMPRRYWRYMTEKQ